MSTEATKQPRTRLWQVAVCLCVAVLCLYNPFFTVYGDFSNVQVCHPLSYRGTLASSELRRCVLDPVVPLIPDIVVLGAWAQVQDGFLDQNGSSAVRPSNDLPAIQEVILDGLWFRPPPKS